MFQITLTFPSSLLVSPSTEMSRLSTIKDANSANANPLLPAACALFFHSFDHIAQASLLFSKSYALFAKNTGGVLFAPVSALSFSSSSSSSGFPGSSRAFSSGSRLLCTQNGAPIVSFQQLAASFCKTTGVGYPLRPLDNLRLSQKWRDFPSLTAPHATPTRCRMPRGLVTQTRKLKDLDLRRMREAESYHAKR